MKKYTVSIEKELQEDLDNACFVREHASQILLAHTLPAILNAGFNQRLDMEQKDWDDPTMRLRRRLWGWFNEDNGVTSKALKKANRVTCRLSFDPEAEATENVAILARVCVYDGKQVLYKFGVSFNLSGEEFIDLYY